MQRNLIISKFIFPITFSFYEFLYIEIQKFLRISVALFAQIYRINLIDIIGTPLCSPKFRSKSQRLKRTETFKDESFLLKRLLDCPKSFFRFMHVFRFVLFSRITYDPFSSVQMNTATLHRLDVSRLYEGTLLEKHVCGRKTLSRQPDVYFRLRNSCQRLIFLFNFCALTFVANLLGWQLSDCRFCH